MLAPVYFIYSVEINHSRHHILGRTVVVIPDSHHPSPPFLVAMGRKPVFNSRRWLEFAAPYFLSAHHQNPERLKNDPRPIDEAYLHPLLRDNLVVMAARNVAINAIHKLARELKSTASNEIKV